METESVAALRARVRQVDQELREATVSAALEVGTLRAVEQGIHAKPGWYTGMSTVDLHAAGYRVREEELLFPVPASSSTWHSAEIDAATGQAFRFFARHAHLEIETTGRPVTLRILFGVTPDAIAATEASCPEAEVSYRQTPGGREIILTPAPGAVRMTVSLICPIAVIPAKSVPGSTDQRFLSVAIAAPVELS